MPQFTVIPKNAPLSSMVVNVDAPEHVLGTVVRLECQRATVLCDGEYAFTIQRGGKGAWVISNFDADYVI